MKAVVVYESPCRGDYAFRGIYNITDVNAEKTPIEIIKDCLCSDIADYTREELKAEIEAGYYSFFFIEPTAALKLRDISIDVGTDSAHYAVMDGWLELCRRFEVRG